MPTRVITCSALVHLLRPGMRVFIHAGPAESPALREALQAAPEAARGVEFFGIFIPGINDFDYAGLQSDARASGPFVPPTARKTFEAGRFEFTPVHYSELGSYVASRPIDLAILHCPPDRTGLFSLGVNADVAAIAARKAVQCAVIVNEALPDTQMPELLESACATYVVEGEGEVLDNPSEPSDDISERIAVQVASLVRDGDTVQIGIGRLPAAILRKLGQHRRLKMHTGMITDEVAELGRLGALDTQVRSPIVTGMAVGTAKVRDFSRQPLCSFGPVEVTHDVRRIAAIDSFIAINSAVEVDLFGQVNGELINGKQMSGIGGSSDFARGARLSPGGRGVIALPATARGKSRIVTQAAGPVSQSRCDADYVVTEYGAASLRNRSIDARAEALIAIADPAHRAALSEAWRSRRASL